MRSRRLLECLLCTAALSALAAAQDTSRVSVDSAGIEGDGDSGFFAFSAISGDGRYVAFESAATNLVANDTNGFEDVFVRDRETGVTERVSVDSAGNEGNGDSGSFLFNVTSIAISADGNLVVFCSSATNLVANDTNGTPDIFVHDRTTGVTERVSVDSSGGEATGNSAYPAISADGQVVAFWSDAANLVANDTNGKRDVFVHDRSTGITERVSVDSSGGEAKGSSGWDGVAISGDGNVVAFGSDAANLVANDTNGFLDVFVHDRTTGVTERVSVRSNGNQANNDSYTPSLSADGDVVGFYSLATNLVVGDTNGVWDVFVRTRSTGQTERVSVDSTGAQADGDSDSLTLSADGTIVAFRSQATNLVANDTNATDDVFVRDRTTGVTERASVDSSGAQANGGAPTLSADGLTVAFASFASNLVPNDTNGFLDVFTHELCSTVATWSNYDAGFPGTNGVPTFTSRSNPVLGSSLTLDLSNSYAIATAGLLFIGFSRTSIHSSWGGDLLVLPVVTLPIAIPAGGATFTGSLPHDDSLCGFTVDLQALEADPGAVKGVSFTPGLELLVGR